MSLKSFPFYDNHKYISTRIAINFVVIWCAYTFEVSNRRVNMINNQIFSTFSHEALFMYPMFCAKWIYFYDFTISLDLFTLFDTSRAGNWTNWICNDIIAVRGNGFAVIWVLTEIFCCRSILDTPTFLSKVPTYPQTLFFHGFDIGDISGSIHPKFIFM